MRQDNSLARFYAGLFIPIVLSTLFMAFCALLLERSGEYLSLSEIRQKLEASHGVYSSAVNSRAFWLKQDIYLSHKPDIAVLGSSRVLQFRSQFFSKNFANLGGMRNFYDTTEMAHRLLDSQPPKVLVIGIDFWWFSPVYQNLEFTRSPPEGGMTASDLFEMAGWMVAGKLTLASVGAILRQSSPNIGIQGIVNNEGIDASGALINSSLVFGKVPSDDIRFKSTLGKIADGDQKFAHSARPDEAKLEKLDELLAYLSKTGTHIVLVLPPLSPTAFDAIAARGDEYGYISPAVAHLRQKAKQYNFPFFDFHDPRKLGSGDCEMLDGIHGGPVLYARMLKAISQHDPVIRAYLDAASIESAIITHAGHASLFDSGEADFLKIGCKR